MSLKVLEFGPCNVLNLRKQPTFWNTTTVFPGKQHLRKEHRNSILMTCHYPDLGSAWSCNIFASTKLFEAKFPRCTTNQKLCQIWVVTHLHFGISLHWGNQWCRQRSAVFSGFINFLHFFVVGGKGDKGST